MMCCSSGQQASMVEQVLREIVEYVGRNYDYGTDLQLTIQKVKEFDVPMPGDVDSNTSDTEKFVWNKRVT